MFIYYIKDYVQTEGDKGEAEIFLLLVHFPNGTTIRLKPGAAACFRSTGLGFRF